MLDYEFVSQTNCADTLRAIMKSLKSGEHGKYPHLEKTVCEKIISVLPDKERNKILAMRSRVSVDDIKAERGHLQEWLNQLSNEAPSRHVAQDPAHQEVSSTDFGNQTPVRRVEQRNEEIALQKTNAKPTSVKSADGLIRKEKLSTKDYFDLWDKFDCEDSEEETDADGIRECQAKLKAEESDDAKRRRESDIFQLQKRLLGNELTAGERKFLSLREREKGNEYFRCSENEEAIACYTKSVLLESNAESYANRAMASIRLSDYDLAIEDCTKAIEIKPAYLKPLARRGMVYHKTGRYEEAIADFRACVQLDPNSDYERFVKRSEEKLHQTTKSTLVIEEITEPTEENDASDDDVEEIYTPGAISMDKQTVRNKGTSFESKKNFDKDNGSARRCNVDKNADSKEVQSKNMRGSSDSPQMSIVQTTNIVDDFNELRRIAIVEDDEDESEATKEVSSDVEEDKTQLRRVQVEMSVSESDFEIRNAQCIKSDELREEGNAAMKKGEYSTAMHLYSKALDLSPQSACSLNNRSLAYIKIKNWTNAINDATSCLEVDPNNTKALYRRGFATLMQGKEDPLKIKSAQKDFQLALSLDPPNDQTKVLMRKLRECKDLLANNEALDNQKPADCIPSDGGQCSRKKEECLEIKKKSRSHDSDALFF